MPVGVPETEVHAAADRVLARGERPTVVSVRAELGRGSPARVGQLLEQWWDALAKRLAGEMRLPDVPPAVAGAFRTFWSGACELANESAQAGLAEQRAQVQVHQAELERARGELERPLAEAAAQCTAALQAKELAQARLAELERLVGEVKDQLQDARGQ